MRRVIIESPYAGDTERNRRYLQACIRDCLRRGESPYASHQMLTGVLDDDDPEQRKTGIEAGFAWAKSADEVVFYTDLGWSDGMKKAKKKHRERYFYDSSYPHSRLRYLGVDWETKC